MTRTSRATRAACTTRAAATRWADARARLVAPADAAHHPRFFVTITVRS